MFKLIKILLKFFIPFFIVFMIITSILSAILMSTGNIIKDFEFNKEVEACRTLVEQYSIPILEENGISKSKQDGFVDLFLSMIQVHADYNIKIGTDPMNIFYHKKHDKHCTYCVNNRCTNKQHSIQSGIKFVSTNFKKLNVKSIKDEDKIKESLAMYFDDIEPNAIHISSKQYATLVYNYYISISQAGISDINGSDIVQVAKYYADKKQNGAIFQSKYGYGRDAAWCTLFCMYCADKVGLSREVAPLHPYVPTVVDNFQAKGQYHSASSGYTPKAGDFVILFGQGHIGIVAGRKGNTLYTIEGNRSFGGTYSNSTSFVGSYSDQTVRGVTGYCTYNRK